MTDKELKKLGRTELLEMLIDQSTELQDCKKKLAAAEAALQKREIAINKAGSTAEASLLLSGIFDSAQVACQQNIENIRQLSERQEAVCAQLESESRVKAEQILAEAEREREEMARMTKAQCAEMVVKARAEAQQYWDEVSGKLEKFYEDHAGLRELMLMGTSPKRREDV